MTLPPPIPPGATIGILGGGQLGRMIALAAAALGYRCHVLSPEADGPAAQVCGRSTLAAYDDEAALAAFAASIAVATFEFENVPAATAAFLATRIPVRPGPEALRIAQDRVLEKSFVHSLGIATAPWAKITDEPGLKAALARIGRPAILKTARMGYDGKGQVRIAAAADDGGDDDGGAAAWRALGGVRAVVEAEIAFRCEISVIAARGQDGAIACYVPVENAHVGGILATTIAPARIPRRLREEAIEIAMRIAIGLDLVGLVAVEMFVTEDERILVNEIAPRPHNSGHWTMDACGASQFEQLVRAICGLPLAAPERHSDAMMHNLIGSDVERWREVADPRARLHLYGKREPRPGRKMGHVTRLSPRS